jgi:hypothetical protein
MKRRVRGHLLFFFIFVIALFYTTNASANPIPVNPDPPNPSVDGFIMTFIINLPIDFIFLVISARVSGLVLHSPISLLASRKHALLTILITIVIATCGAAIDQLLVAKPLYDFGHLQYYPDYNPDIIMDYIGMFVALLLIFLSVILCVHFAFKFKKRVTVLIGVGMLVFNILSWYLFLFLTSI